MATTTSTQDIDPNANSGPSILGAIIFTWGVALIVLILRFVARRISRVGYWADDWLVLAAFVFHSAVIGLFVASVVVGAGRHTQVLTKAQYSKIEILFLSGELVFNFAVNLPKLSILAFYWRIFSINPGIKLPVKITGVTVTLWILISTFILLFQCSPPSKLAHPEYPGHCLSKWGVFVGGSIPNLVFDVVILAIPIPFIWKLQMGSRQKVFLSILFFLGGLACVSSALRLWAFATRDYTSDDLTWTATDPIIWSCAEAAMAIIAACVLSLRPVVTYVRTGSATPTTSAEKSFSRARLLKSGSGRSSDRTNPTAHSFTQTTITDRELESALGGPGGAPEDTEHRPHGRQQHRSEARIEPGGGKKHHYEWVGWDRKCPVHGEDVPQVPEASKMPKTMKEPDTPLVPRLLRRDTGSHTQHPSDSDESGGSSSRQQYEWVGWDSSCPVHHDGPAQRPETNQRRKEMDVPLAIRGSREDMTALPSLGPESGLATFYLDDESP